MDKIKHEDQLAKSADIVSENIAQLQSLFPEAFVEGKIDFEVLKQLLGGAVEEREEKYGLNWHGKRAARQLALTPSMGTLRPCPEESVDWETTQNLMIEGDNLEVLKLLQKSYTGKVKLIYIDPPYNKGKDFVYPDNYQDSIKNYLEITGQVVGGCKIGSNSEVSGRFHTDWLNMMYARLSIAKSLLRRDGIIMISIDDKELYHLRLLANEIFGEENFISTISVVTNLKGRNDKKYISSCHEYIVIYAFPDFVSLGLPLTDEQRAYFKYTDEEGNKYALRDLRKRGGPDKREDRPNMYFPIYWDRSRGTCKIERTCDDDIEIFPIKGDGSDGRWRWGKERVQKYMNWIEAKQSERTGKFDVEHRVYLDANVDVDCDDDQDEDIVVERTSKPKSIWIGGEYSTDSGKRSFKELIPGDVFDFPKSIDLIRTGILISTSDDDIVLDFFAGTGTTGVAVLNQNSIDMKKRRYILIQLQEPLSLESKEQKSAARFCNSIRKPLTIAEITKERLRRAGKKIREQNPMFAGDTGFRVFKLDSSNIRAWNPDRDNLSQSLMDHIEHILPGRTEADILYEVLLKLGLDLCVPMEKRVFAGKDVHAIGGGVLLACLNTNISRDDVEALGLGIVAWHKELAPAGESTVVFRDNGFADDVAKTNLTAILHQNGLTNVRSL